MDVFTREKTAELDVKTSRVYALLLGVPLTPIITDNITLLTTSVLPPPDVGGCFGYLGYAVVRIDHSKSDVGRLQHVVNLTEIMPAVLDNLHYQRRERTPLIYIKRLHLTELLNEQSINSRRKKARTR